MRMIGEMVGICGPQLGEELVVGHAARPAKIGDGDPSEGRADSGEVGRNPMGGGHAATPCSAGW